MSRKRKLAEMKSKREEQTIPSACIKYGCHLTKEKWAPVPGASKYEVSDHGRLRNVETLRCLSLGNGSYSRGVVKMDKQNKFCSLAIHRLVAQAFLERPDS